METNNKLFAFKLANKEEARKDARANEGKWTARSGAPVAGCTDPTGDYDFRYSKSFGTDNGVWC
jgi:hypothetical protein